MGILGDATTVLAQTGRKLNNALTVTFKTSADATLATAVQSGSLGVLLGFRNGGGGRYKLSGHGIGLVVDCAADRTQLTGGSDQAVGGIEKDANGDGVVRAADRTVLARVIGQPKEQRHDSTWQHPLTDADGAALGLLSWVRSSGTFDLLGALEDLDISWNQAGESLKVPSLGASLALGHPVPEVLGDLLLAVCVDMTVGSHSFIAS